MGLIRHGRTFIASTTNRESIWMTSFLKLLDFAIQSPYRTANNSAFTEEQKPRLAWKPLIPWHVWSLKIPSPPRHPRVTSYYSIQIKFNPTRRGRPTNIDLLLSSIYTLWKGCWSSIDSFDDFQGSFLHKVLWIVGHKIMIYKTSNIRLLPTTTNMRLQKLWTSYSPDLAGDPSFIQARFERAVRKRYYGYY